MNVMGYMFPDCQPDQGLRWLVEAVLQARKDTFSKFIGVEPRLLQLCFQDSTYQIRRILCSAKRSLRTISHYCHRGYYY
jgi:hypothetical protein